MKRQADYNYFKSGEELWAHLKSGGTITNLDSSLENSCYVVLRGNDLRYNTGQKAEILNPKTWRACYPPAKTIIEDRLRIGRRNYVHPDDVED